MERTPPALDKEARGRKFDDKKEKKHKREPGGLSSCPSVRSGPAMTPLPEWGGWVRVSDKGKKHNLLAIAAPETVGDGGDRAGRESTHWLLKFTNSVRRG